MKKSTGTLYKYKSHALSCDLCSYTDEFGDPQKIELFKYKKRLFIVESTYYTTHIYYCVYAFNEKHTKALHQCFQSSTSKELFNSIASNFLTKGKEDLFLELFKKFCNIRSIEYDRLIEKSYTFNKERYSFRRSLLRDFRDTCYVMIKNYEFSHPQIVKAHKKSTPFKHIVTKFLHYDIPTKIALYYYKSCFFYVQSSYGRESIRSDVVALSAKNTAKLFQLFRVQTSLQLFHAFERAFMRNECESHIQGVFMDFCEYSTLNFIRESNRYVYNEFNGGAKNLTQFLLRQFDHSFALSID